MHVVGRENIPPKGTPTFCISNHQNGLMDALAILYLFDDHRQPVFIARGDIFRKDYVAKFLRYLKILPAFRSRDGDREDMKRNFALMDLESRILREGGTLGMFPEAGHQAGHFMTTFKKGFPRIAFKAEETANFDLNLQILPMNIHYTNYFHIREELLVVVGKPFTLKEFFELYKEEPNKAYLALNEKARSIIKSMTLDVEDHEHYEEIDMLRNLWHTPLKEMDPAKGDSLYQQEQEDIELVKQLADMKETDTPRFDKLMADSREYIDGLKKLNLRDWLINRKVTLPMLLFKALLLVLCFPVYLFGFLNHIVPFKTPELFKRNMKDKMFSSSINFALSALCTYRLWFILLFIAAWIVIGKFWLAAIYIAVAFASLFPYFAYKCAVIKWLGAFRYWKLNKNKSQLLYRLKELKSECLYNPFKK